MNSSFDALAPLYDRLMSKVPYISWLSYYRLLLAKHELQPQSFLDVCCGTGTLAEKLAADGFSVTGFDVSEPMIREAKRKIAASGLNVDYVVADAASLDLGRRFDAAYSFFDSLNYIIEHEQLRRAIKRVAEHLEPGGSFIFDVNTAYAFEKRMFDQQDLRKQTQLKYRWKGEYDPESRLIHIHMKFWDGKEALSVDHVQRAYSDDELRAYLSEAGFNDVSVFDSYTLSPARERSDRLHYVATLQSG